MTEGIALQAISLDIQFIFVNENRAIAGARGMKMFVIRFMVCWACILSILCEFKNINPLSACIAHSLISWYDCRLLTKCAIFTYNHKNALALNGKGEYLDNFIALFAAYKNSFRCAFRHSCIRFIRVRSVLYHPHIDTFDKNYRDTCSSYHVRFNVCACHVIDDEAFCYKFFRANT